MFRDTRNLEMTATSQEAVDAFDATVNEFLAAGRDAAVLLKHVNEADPDMIMGQCVRGYFMRLPQQAHLLQGSHDAYERAKALAPAANARERMHVAALGAWVDGNIRKTKAIWEQIVTEYPHDILALRIAHTMHFFLGDLDLMRDSMAQVMPRWSEEVPGYGFVLGCRAFSLEESNDFARAETMGRRAVEINEDDVWAGHCVAHVLEGMGRRNDGIQWIDEHEQAWKRRGSFARHMWWHRTLHYLEFERYDDVLSAFDREFWPAPSEENLDITNAASMLMRLDMLGIDVGTRWGVRRPDMRGSHRTALASVQRSSFHHGLDKKRQNGRRAGNPVVDAKFCSCERQHDKHTRSGLQGCRNSGCRSDHCACR